MSHRRRVLALLLTLASGSAAVAGPLVRIAPRPHAAGMPSERGFVVDGAALADLRGRETATIEEFPLGGDGPVTLDLRRIRPFSPTARIEEVTDAGVRTIPLPDESYFGGTVRGATQSRVLLIAGADGVRGFVVRDGATYPFGRDASGAQRVYALRDVDPAAFPGPTEFCGNDLRPDGLLSVPVPRAAPMPAPAATIGPDTVLEVQAAIETDNEFRNKFGSATSATNYLASLLAAANVIYERDVKVRLTFSYVRLWLTTDPWTATDTSGALDELQTYWLDPTKGMDAKAGEHDLVHFISGKSVQGGVAYIQAVCNHDYGFGVSQVFGSFDVSNPNGIWDVLVFTHEVGHNLGSEHTHCYNPPLDHCFNQEPGCYSGPVELPQGGGTIMSYCHLVNNSLADVNLLFGATVSSTIRSFVTSVSCLSVAPVCGNGTLEAGEQCDDGNTANGDGCSSACEIEGTCGDGAVGAGEQCDDGNTAGGDGCSATCQLETVCGNGVVEGVEQCDDGNTLSGDGCSAKCRLETVCGNGMREGIEGCDDGNTVGGDGCSAACRVEQCGNHYVDVGEECDDGNTVSGDGCSSTCVHEPLCGDGTLDPGEACDDGNAKSGDGCSSTCLVEPCQVKVPHQTTWAPAKLIATPRTFALRARFGVPSDALDLGTVAASGLHLFVDGDTGARAMDVVVPGGAAWLTAGARLRYRDPSGSAGGVRAIGIRTRNDGVTQVDVKISSHGGPVPDVNDAPPTVTILLGGDAAGVAGACGRYAFEPRQCVKRGRRLTCR